MRLSTPPAVSRKEPRLAVKSIISPRNWSTCTTQYPGIRFAPLTGPPMLTGKYTTSTGIVINEIRIKPDQKCFAHVLNERHGGYFDLVEWL